MDQSCEEKKFIPLHGMLMEVTPEQYREFYRNHRRQKYLDERSKDNGDISIDMLATPKFNGADILVSSEDIEEQVVLRMMVDKLRSCLLMLSEEERELLHDLFYIGLSERDAAEKYAVSQVAIHKRKKSVLDKLKKMMDR